MAVSTQDQPAGQVAQALVAFTLSGDFPEEDVSSIKLGPDELPPAIRALADAKSKLEADIHAINEETAADVGSWQANAKSVQDDVVRSKALANEISKQADSPAVSGKAIDDLERKADFLVRELNYNQQVQEALRRIQEVNRTLDRAEQASNERRILDALHLLEKSWAQMDVVPVSKSCRAMKLLHVRAFELKTDVHRVFDHVWNALVHVDHAEGRFSVSSSRQGEPMSLADAIVGLKAYKEEDQRMEQLWRDLDQVIVGPRMDPSKGTPPAIRLEGDVLKIGGIADESLKSLFRDLEQVFQYMEQRFPPDMLEAISLKMVPTVISRLMTVWLDSAVPSSLRDMDEFQEVVALTKEFCTSLTARSLSGFDGLQEWINSAPRVWLNKFRETALDSVRSKLSTGLGESKQVEKVEKQIVSPVEGKELATKSAAAVDADDHGWDVEWSDGEDTAAGAVKAAPPAAAPASAEPAGEDDGTDAWGWGDDEPGSNEKAGESKEPSAEEEDPTEAWGWGDDDQKQESQRNPPLPENARAQTQQTRELVFKETYNISSMPEPVLSLIFAILEDGAALTQAAYDHNPAAAAAPGLFSLPTLALAMFRALSPHYYAFDIGGSMYLYNDAIYLAERLEEFASDWKGREDISAKARSMLRLDNDVRSLQSFANRAYGNELNTQKMVLRDLLGGEQNVMQQDEADGYVDSAVARVRSMAGTWEGILSRSVWYQAVGSLVDAVSTKMIADVIEMPSIGQEEAYSIAKLIAAVTELDDLFLPSRFQNPAQRARSAEAGEVPSTAQYASSWLRLKYLSEVLQSNLQDVRYLWMDSELSLYFSAEEVVDLINLSFEDNARTREVIREITQNPQPR